MLSAFLSALGVIHRCARIGCIGCRTSACEGQRRQQKIEQVLLGTLLCKHLDLLTHLLFNIMDRNIGKVPDHALNIATHIPHLGILCRLHFNEWSTAYVGKPPRDFSLSHSGWPYHDNVFRRHLVPEFLGKILSPIAISQRYGNSLFGLVLSNDIFVKLRHDLCGSQLIFSLLHDVSSINLLNNYAFVGVNTDRRGNLEGFLYDFPGRHLCP